MKDSTPNYIKIYSDIIKIKFPEKEQECNNILYKKNNLSLLDVIKLNSIIFGSPKNLTKDNQRHKSYKKEDILQILMYQKRNKLNNKQVATHFKLSRNTIAKWRKIFHIKFIDKNR